MSKERIILQIKSYINKIRGDYQSNIISVYQYELLNRELLNLIENIDNTDAIITLSKFDMLRTVYIIMK